MLCYWILKGMLLVALCMRSFYVHALFGFWKCILWVRELHLSCDLDWFDGLLRCVVRWTICRNVGLYDPAGILWPTAATDYNEFLSHKTKQGANVSLKTWNILTENRLALYLCKLATTHCNIASRPVATVTFLMFSTNSGSLLPLPFSRKESVDEKQLDFFPAHPLTWIHFGDVNY